MSYRVRHPDMHQEEDVVPARSVLAFVGVVVLVSAVLIVWTAYVVRGSLRELRPSGAFPERYLGPRHMVARVRQDLFDERLGGRSLNQAKRRDLETYGWVDKERGVVRIPIDRAMDLVVQGKRP